LGSAYKLSTVLSLFANQSFAALQKMQIVGSGGQTCHRTKHREVHRAVAVFRDRTHALGAAVPVWRRRPYRPPTVTEGLNTAASDVHYLYNDLLDYYENGIAGGIDAYSAKALARAWKAEWFSWWLSSQMHRYPDQSEFNLRMQIAELEFLRSNNAAQQVMAENYVGLTY
jgi:hypothetical protein